MADFLSRLSQRALGTGEVLRPGTPSLYAPPPAAVQAAGGGAIYTEADRAPAVSRVSEQTTVIDRSIESIADPDRSGGIERHVEQEQERLLAPDVRGAEPEQRNIPPAVADRGNSRGALQPGEDAESAGADRPDALGADRADSRPGRRSATEAGPSGGPEEARSVERTVLIGGKEKPASRTSPGEGDSDKSMELEQLLVSPDFPVENRKRAREVDGIEAPRSFESAVEETSVREPGRTDHPTRLLPTTRPESHEIEKRSRPIIGGNDVGRSDAPATRQLPPAISITIGRIEVRAVTSPRTEQRRQVPEGPALSLDAYLGQLTGKRS